MSGDEQNRLDRTMPVLQEMQLYSSGAPISSDVPFPWCPDLIRLPLGLMRTDNFNYAYTVSIGIAPLTADLYRYRHCWNEISLIARFMGPTWGPSGADRTQVGPMLAPLTRLSRFR